jgi:hypothetical protein
MDSSNWANDKAAREKSIQTKLPWSRSKLTPKELNPQQNIPTETRPQIFKPAQPPTKQIQTDTFTEILQDRISEALSRIDTREAMSLQRIRAEMATLQQFEMTWQETQSEPRKFSNNRTHLMLACHLGHLKVVPALLKHDGEDVFLKNNDGKTALDSPRRNAETT